MILRTNSAHLINPFNAEMLSYESWQPKGFIQFEIIIHCKHLSYLIPLHLNTYMYVMGLRPLEIFLIFQCVDGL